MIGKLIDNLLQVNAATGVSANLTDSQSAGVRVYHQRIPQNQDHPAVVWSLVTQVPGYCKKAGAAGEQIRVQFDILHPDDFEAATIAQNLRNIIEGWAGTFDGVRYNYTTIDAMRDGYEDEIGVVNRIVEAVFRKS